MCLAKESSPSPQKDSVQPRSPWMKLLNRQSLKPRLPRKVSSSAKVNLNKCWSKLGELISNTPPRTDLPSYDVYNDEPLLIPFSEYLYPVDPVKPVPVEENESAEIQNVLNSNRFQLVSDDQEIYDNMANEVREICYAADSSNCMYCKLCY